MSQAGGPLIDFPISRVTVSQWKTFFKAAHHMIYILRFCYDLRLLSRLSSRASIGWCWNIGVNSSQPLWPHELSTRIQVIKKNLTFWFMQKIPTKIEINQVSDRIGNIKDNSYSQLGLRSEFLKNSWKSVMSSEKSQPNKLMIFIWCWNFPNDSRILQEFRNFGQKQADDFSL